MPDPVKVLQDALNDPSLADRHDEIRAALKQAQQKAMAHTPGEGASQAVVGASHENDGPSEGDTRLGRFNDHLMAMGRGVGALGGAVMHPIETAQDPAKVRQLVRGADDIATLGYGRKLADALPPIGPFHRNPSFTETEAADEDEAPDERVGGSMVAAMLPNPLGLVTRGAGAAMGRIGRVAQRPVAGAAMGAGRALGTYELTAPAFAGLHANSAGNRLEAAKEAATDPLGLFIAGGGGAVGGGAQGKAARIRSPKTQSGRVLQDIEAAKGRVRKFGRPVEGGMFDDPEMQGLPEGRAGYNRLADQSAQRVAGANKSRLSAARAQFGDTIDQVIAEHGDEPHPTLNAHAALDAEAEENTVNGVIVDEGRQNAINKVRRMLTQESDEVNENATLHAMRKKMGIPPHEALTPQAHRALRASATPEDLVMKRAPQISAGDMIKARKAVRLMANNAATPSENRVYEAVLGAMDEDAAAMDPRIREMNAKFSAAMGPIERSNSILFGKQGRDPEITDAQRATGARRLGQLGDTTQAGTVRDPQMEEFAQLGPEYGREAKLMRAMKAQERLRRGAPETSDAIEKTIRAPGRYNRTALGLLAGPLAPFAVPIGLAMDKYAENPLANQVRLTLPAAERVGKTITGSSAGPIDAIARMAANRGKKRRKREEEEDASP